MKWYVGYHILPTEIVISHISSYVYVHKYFRYEKSGHLIGNEYFLHAYGPIYVLSAEVVAPLATARNNRSVTWFYMSYYFFQL